jgi:hypothetical protein
VAKGKGKSKKLAGSERKKQSGSSFFDSSIAVFD